MHLSATESRLAPGQTVDQRDLDQLESPRLGLNSDWYERLEYHGTNWAQWTTLQQIRYLSGRGRFPEVDFGSGESRSVLRSVARDTGERFAVRNLPIVDRLEVLFDNIAEGKIFSFFMNGVSGQEEKDQISSPFDDVRLPLSQPGVRSGFSEGMRPFRTNPYFFVNYTLGYGGDEMFTIQSRVYYRYFEDLVGEVVLQIPIDATSWKFGIGYRYEQRSESDLFNEDMESNKRNGIFIGLHGSILGGMFHFEYELSPSDASRIDPARLAVVYSRGF